MFKKINFKNRKFVSVLTIVLTFLLIVGVASSFIFIKPKESSNKIDTSKFVIGKITSNGSFLPSDDYLCTNDLIACDGLVVKPTYNAKSKFQIFFYDVNYQFVFSTEQISEKYEFIDSVPFVEYCRIMIIPDREGKIASEFKINVFNKSSFIKEFEISVDTKQVFGSYKDYFEEDLTLQNMVMNPSWGADTGTGRNYIFYDECAGYGVSKVIDLTGVDHFYFVTNKILSNTFTRYLCFEVDKNNNILNWVARKEYSISSSKDYYYYKVDCSKFNSALFNYCLDSECHLFLEKN